MVKLINVDVNGSYNILRKTIPNAFVNGIEVVVVQLVIMKVITN
jgi:putative transposase